MVFFAAGCIGGVFGAYELKKHKDKFPASEGVLIDRIWILSLIVFMSGVATSVSLGLWGVNYWAGPTFEWITVLLFLNFYTIFNFTNPYYSSITEPGTLVPVTY